MKQLVGLGNKKVEETRWTTFEQEAPESESVLIEIAYASLNYKDILIGSGQVPAKTPVALGIDGVGRVVKSANDTLPIGTRVAAIGKGLGESTRGTFATHTIASAEQCVVIPESLTDWQAAHFGTVGLTAAEAALRTIETHNNRSEPIVVTGANGAVGSLVSRYLQYRGYHTLGMVRSEAARQYLAAWNIDTITPHTRSNENPPLINKGKFSAIIDTVGGDQLGYLLPQLLPGGTAISIGNTAGNYSSMSLLPFILRAIRLEGLNTDALSPSRRQACFDAFTQWVTTENISFNGAVLAPEEFSRQLTGDSPTNERIFFKPAE